MAAQIASAEKRFCGLLHTVTAEFVDGALARRGDPSPGRVVAAEAEPMEQTAAAATAATVDVPSRSRRHQPRPVASMRDLPSWERKVHVCIRAVDRDFDRAYSVTLPTMHLRAALRGRLDYKHCSPLTFLNNCLELVVVQASLTNRDRRTMQVVLCQDVRTGMNWEGHDVHVNNRVDPLALARAAAERRATKKEAADKAADVLARLRIDEGGGRFSVVIAGPCSDPRLKCQGFGVDPDLLTAEHVAALVRGEYIRHAELLAYGSCHRCGRGSGWHLPTELEIEEKNRRYDEMMGRAPGASSSASSQHSSASSRRRRQRRRRRRKLLRERMRKGLVGNSGSNQGGGGGEFLGGDSDEDEDEDDENEDDEVPTTVLAGRCTVPNALCDGFEVENDLLMPAHLHVLNHEPAAEKDFKPFIKHAELLCYARCYNCDRGPGWHLPSADEIAFRLSSRSPAVKKAKNAQDKSSRLVIGNMKTGKHVGSSSGASEKGSDGYGGEDSVQKPASHIVRISGPCVHPKAACPGFAIALDMLLPSHIVQLTGGGSSPGLEDKRGSGIIEVEGENGEEAEAAPAPAVSHVGAQFQHSVYLDHPSRPLTQGQILEYAGFYCLDCKKGPGWHLPAQIDPFHFTHPVDREKSLQFKVQSMHRMLSSSSPPPAAIDQGDYSAAHVDTTGSVADSTESDEIAWVHAAAAAADAADQAAEPTRRNSIMARTRNLMAQRRENSQEYKDEEVRIDAERSARIKAYVRDARDDYNYDGSTGQIRYENDALPTTFNIVGGGKDEDSDVAGIVAESSSIISSMLVEEHEALTRKISDLEKGNMDDKRTHQAELQRLRLRLVALDEASKAEREAFVSLSGQRQQELAELAMRQKDRLEQLKRALAEEEARQVAQKSMWEREGAARRKALQRMQQRREEELAAAKIQGMAVRRSSRKESAAYVSRVRARRDNANRVMVLEEQSSGVKGVKEEEEKEEEVVKPVGPIPEEEMVVVEEELVEDGVALSEKVVTVDEEGEQVVVVAEEGKPPAEKRQLAPIEQLPQATPKVGKKSDEALKTSKVAASHLTCESPGRTSSARGRNTISAFPKQDSKQAFVTLESSPSQRTRVSLARPPPRPSSAGRAGSQPVVQFEIVAMPKKSKASQGKSKMQPKQAPSTNISASNSKGKRSSRKKKKQDIANTYGALQNLSAPEWEQASTKVGRLEKDLQDERDARTQLAEEIRVLREYVLYRALKQSENKGSPSASASASASASSPQKHRQSPSQQRRPRGVSKGDWQRMEYVQGFRDEEKKNHETFERVDDDHDVGEILTPPRWEYSNVVEVGGDSGGARRSSHHHGGSSRKKSDRLPRLWQMHWTERYNIISSSYLNAGRPKGLPGNRTSAEMIADQRRELARLQKKTEAMKRKDREDMMSRRDIGRVQVFSPPSRRKSRPASASPSRSSTEIFSSAFSKHKNKKRGSGSPGKKKRRKRPTSAAGAGVAAKTQTWSENGDAGTEGRDKDRDENEDDGEDKDQDKDKDNGEKDAVPPTYMPLTAGLLETNEEEMERRQSVIKQNFGPSGTQHQSNQHKWRKNNGGVSGRNKMGKASKKKPLFSRQRPQSAVSRMKRRRKHKANKKKTSKKERASTDQAQKFLDRALGEKDIGLPSTARSKTLQTQFNVLGYSTMPLPMAANPRTSPIKTRGSPLVSEYLMRTNATPKKVAPLFDEWMTTEGGQQYQRRQKRAAGDFVSHLGKEGMLGDHRLGAL